ncbi:prephenate dehydratase [Phytophthora boehmeriae]|uniref:Prephenate dehydratase n=1 Tax=Phytophthora boehmeriae TaxID=109152 RepID=A0A8T1X2G4_9STRA|nr:prephenate dehydratase [Phytophthora boehmeriae]
MTSTPFRSTATPRTDAPATAPRAERHSTVSSALSSNGGSTITWASESEDEDERDEKDRLPTFESCSRAIISAAENMEMLATASPTLSVAIAYEECMDIVTAAVSRMEEIGSQGVLHHDVIAAYRAMRDIRELLRPTLPVRRTLNF